MQKDFITITPDAGNAGTTSVSATPAENTAETARSTTVYVKGSGVNKTISFSQAAAVITWNYYFGVSPTSLAFVPGGESKAVTVTSYRRRVVNGVETATQENVAYSSTISGTGFTQNSGGTSITAANNTGSARTGTVSYTQGTSGKTASVSLSQSAAVITWNYYITASPTSLSFVALGELKPFTVDSYRLQVINGVETATRESVNWVVINSYLQTFTLEGLYPNYNIRANENTSSSYRYGEVRIEQQLSGKTASISLTQAPAVIEWKYVLTPSKYSESYDAVSSTSSIDITSYRIQTVNGKEVGSQEFVDWTFYPTQTWLSGVKESSGGTPVRIRISATQNTGSNRNGSMVITQNTSSKTANITINQSGNSGTIKYINARSNLILGLFSSSDWPGKDNNYYLVWDISAGSGTIRSWSGYITVSNPSTGVTVNLTTGSKIYARASTGPNQWSSWTEATIVNGTTTLNLSTI